MEKTIDGNEFLECLKNEIEEKSFCCVYAYLGKRKKSFVRFLINNGDNFNEWISCNDYPKGKKSVESILEEFLKDGYKLKKIPKAHFRESIFKSVKCKDEYGEIGMSFLALYLIYDGRKCFMVEVESVVKYIEMTLQASKKYSKEKYNLYFRGQLGQWDLKPSLYRAEAWAEHESEMNAQIICDRPDDFKNCNTTFDKLVKLKHYNMPSRLLDITSNPLVGLFFACECIENDQTKSSVGMVLEIYSNLSQEKISVSSDTVTMLAALSNSKRFKKAKSLPEICELDSKSILPLRTGKPEDSKCNSCTIKCDFPEGCDVGKALNDYLCEIIHQCKKESQSELYWDDLCYGELNQCIMVKPPLNNNRIVQQQGSFIMCGLNPANFNTPPDGLYKFFESPINRKKVCYYISPKNCEKILSDLKKLGIDRYYIYPDLDKDIEVRKESIKNIY